MNSYEPKYLPTLTTFFDILGFQNIINEKEPGFIFRVLEKMQKHSTPDDKSKDMFETDAIAFSDSIVRSIHLLSESNLQYPSGLLYHELFQLAWIQGCLIYEDKVFLRGAITDGDLYLNDSIVFGPGLVKAYKLESEHAKYPRILVDDSVIKMFADHPKLLGASHHDFETDYEYIRALTYVDFDGYRFIDYLGSTNNVIEGPESFLDMLGKHFDVVREASNAVAEIPNVLEKYHWVASYHNSVVNEYDDEFFDSFECVKSSYILGDSDVPKLSDWTNPAPTKK